MIKGLYEAHLPVSNLADSVEFYEKLELKVAYRSSRVTFFWIEEGKSWLGLWESDTVKTPYHPALRHIAFHVSLEDIQKAKGWLTEKGIDVVTSFEDFTPERQPLVLDNNPQAHAAIYFKDPDGNSLEFIAPLQLNFEEHFEMMSLEEWNASNR